MTEYIGFRQSRDTYSRYAFLRREEERKEQFLFHLLSLDAVDYHSFTRMLTHARLTYRVYVQTGLSTGYTITARTVRLATSLLPTPHSSSSSTSKSATVSSAAGLIPGSIQSSDNGIGWGAMSASTGFSTTPGTPSLFRSPGVVSARSHAGGTGSAVAAFRQTGSACEVDGIAVNLEAVSVRYA
ncbi:unnamed protein product [Protopolystoma xenopodis]|uniref:Uncharacterized protein n=1 Tax=Protopolystoma xenopodis TaxID=117903 RepID=A0A448X355_9PLAT|nr:unnamed protein product [Protopolystoma xenopodis]